MKYTRVKIGEMRRTVKNYKQVKWEKWRRRKKYGGKERKFLPIFTKISKSFVKSRFPPLALLKPFVTIVMRRFIIRLLRRDFSTLFEISTSESAE
ncbi:MAG: hypothetical protein J6K20_00665 [Thermoguttaceae bacterium]|nr:hypothetical protein [Thermoguttaceae bacterium]MBQ7029729.1 hypothetical protein [Thermoguttaceae bacterium]